MGNPVKAVTRPFTNFIKKPSLKSAVGLAGSLASGVLGASFLGPTIGNAIGSPFLGQVAGGALASRGFDTVFGGGRGNAPSRQIGVAVGPSVTGIPADKTTFRGAEGLSLPPGLETQGSPLQQSTGIATRAVQGIGDTRSLSAQSYLLDQIRKRLIPAGGGQINPGEYFRPIELRNLTEVLGGKPREDTPSSRLSAYERALEGYPSVIG